MFRMVRGAGSLDTEENCAYDVQPGGLTVVLGRCMNLVAAKTAAIQQGGCHSTK